MGCQSLEGVYELYLLEALGGRELEELHAHVEKNCPHCLSQLREAAETLYWLTQSIPIARPTPAVRSRLLRHFPTDHA
jgi:energy-converting hydrogenase A subunit M